MPFDSSTLRVTPHAPHPLLHHRPDDLLGFADKEKAAASLVELLPKLRELHDRLNAQRTWSVLIILQAMDAAGKDGLVKHVFSGFNQQSCHVTAFSAPAGAELSHSFLWRCMAALPARGHIGVFNRSYYEEALVPRVHQEYLGYQRLPPPCLQGDITAPHSDSAKKDSGLPPLFSQPLLSQKKLHAAHAQPSPVFWDARLDDINAFERHLVRNGTYILKFYLNLSRTEQKRRFLTRITDPSRNWKFAPSDARDRADWPAYHHAYSDLLSRTSTPWAPWHIIPADYKYVARLAVAQILQRELTALDPTYPKLDPAAKKDLARAKKLLEKEK